MSDRREFEDDISSLVAKFDDISAYVLTDETESLNQLINQ